MKMSVLNKLLEQRAYTDAHTGLPNKDACEVLLNNKETVAELLLIDDDTLLVDDELLKGLDKELDEFLKNLLEK